MLDATALNVKVLDAKVLNVKFSTKRSVMLPSQPYIINLASRP
jgi:hypothetical protein